MRKGYIDSPILRTLESAEFGDRFRTKGGETCVLLAKDADYIYCSFKLTWKGTENFSNRTVKYYYDGKVCVEDPRYDQKLDIVGRADQSARPSTCTYSADKIFELRTALTTALKLAGELS